MTRDPPDIRPATADDLVGVMRVLDAGLLDTDAETIRTRIADADTPVLVADADGHVVGAVVLGERPAWVAEVFAATVAGKDDSGRDDTAGGCDDTAGGCDDTSGGRDDTADHHVEAVAVGRSRQGRGVGTDLLRTASESVAGDLTADFAESVRPFYESLGCSIRRCSQDGAADAESDRRLVARIGRVGAIPEASGDGEADG